MAVIVAGVTLADGSSPETLSFEDTLNGTDQILSDGTRLHPTTGSTPTAIPLVGTLFGDGHGSALDKARALKAAYAAALPTFLTWDGGTEGVLITRFKATPGHYNQIAYELDLFRGSVGLIAQQGGQQPAGTRASSALDRIAALGSSAGTGTQAAAAALQAARAGSGL